MNQIISKNIIVFDTETLGLFDRNLLYTEYKNCDLLSIGWAYIENYDSTKDYEVDNYYLRKPTFEITNKEFCGLTNEICERDGIEINQILDKFYADLKKCDYVIAHNMSFDKQILLYESHKNNHEMENFILSNSDKFLCTMESSVDICCIKRGNNYKWTSLQDLYTYYTKKEYKHEHNAKRDVEILLEALKYLSKESKPNKIYLNVPYKSKDKVKNLGALWSPNKKSWRIMSSQTEKFKEYMS